MLLKKVPHAYKCSTYDTEEDAVVETCDCHRVAIDAFLTVCLTCKGNGRVEMLEHCPDCGGSGRAALTAGKKKKSEAT